MKVKQVKLDWTSILFLSHNVENYAHWRY